MNAQTSFNDMGYHRIIISGNNVKAMLEKNVNILSVAYHELGHSLFTRIDIMKTIIENTTQILKNDHSNLRRDVNLIKMLYNTLEDQRMERRMINRYSFLNPILGKLPDILEHDDSIMSWRKNAKNRVNPKLWALLEQWCIQVNNGKITEASYTMVDIYVFLLKENEQKEKQKQKQKSNEKKKDNNKDKSDENDTGEGDEKDAGEGDEEEAGEGDEEDAGEGGEDNNSEGDEEDAGGNDSNKDGGTDSKEVDDNEFFEKEFEKAVQKIIDNVEEELQTMRDEKALRDAVITNDKYRNKNDYYTKKIKERPTVKSEIRKGINRIESKKYTPMPSTKISVPKVIEYLSSKHTQEPNVFYNKGKNASFTKKVVVFEDVSASTTDYVGADYKIHNMFSEIAYALIRSFEVADWWIYGTYMYKKQQKDYPYSSYDAAPNTVGGGTHPERLASVIKSYNQEDIVYVLLTDGDMGQLFVNKESSELMKALKNNFAAIGTFEEKYIKKFPHHFRFVDKDGEKLEYANFNCMDAKTVEYNIKSSIMQAVNIIKNKIK